MPSPAMIGEKSANAGLPGAAVPRSWRVGSRFSGLIFWSGLRLPSFCRSHTEQEAKYSHPPDQQLIDGHYDGKRDYRYQYKISLDAAAPLNDKAANQKNYRMVENVERENSLIGIGQGFMVEVQQPGPRPQQADDPAPGQEPPEGLNPHPAGVVQGTKRSSSRHVVPGYSGDDQVEAEMGIHV